MNATVEDLRSTIIPKSDQLNAEQLLDGPITISVTDVRIGDGNDQPVVVHYEGENGRPFKPCKTMRKVLIHAWGANGRQWVGRSMTLYNDPAVKFGGEDVGGIRISHLSDIERDIRVSLNSARGKKAKYEVRRMASETAAALQAISQADTVETLKSRFATAYRSSKNAAIRDQLKATYDARLATLTAAAAGDAEPATYAQLADMVQNCANREEALIVLDQARHLTTELQTDLKAVVDRSHPE